MKPFPQDLLRNRESLSRVATYQLNRAVRRCRFEIDVGTIYPADAVAEW